MTRLPVEETFEIVKIKKFLSDFGFHQRQIANYLALCSTRENSPSEISKITEIERTDTYRILEDLVKKGFVTLQKCKGPLPSTLACTQREKTPNENLLVF